MIIIFSFMIAAYIFGSIPFGLLAGKIRGIDIRTVGSKNIGATNVYRTFGWKYGIPVFLLDAMKGFLPVYFLPLLMIGQESPHYNLLQVLTALFSVLGHNFPVWLKFNGGKGVATSAGAMLGILPTVTLLAFLTFIIVYGFTKYVSLGSIAAGIMLVILNFTLNKNAIRFEDDTCYASILCIVLCLLLLIRHRANIKRLICKEENKTPFK